jgi:DNA modification methylase
MIIKRIKPSKLIPYENNPRNNEDAVDIVANSIKQFGFQNPILIDKNNVIVAGHTRHKAALKLGLDEVPCIRIENLTPEQIRAYRIADNSTADVASWDSALLDLELADLKEFDFANFGLDFFEPEQSEIKEVSFEAKVPNCPTCKLGEIFKLGDHTLMCGDCTILENIQKLIGGKKKEIDLLITDPPYGVAIADKNKFLNSISKNNRITENIEGDTLSPEELYKILLVAFKNAKSVLNDCAAVYVTAPQGGGLGMMMMMMMKDAGLEIRHILNWIKNSPTFSMGRLDYDYQHEPILFTWNKTHKKIMKGEYQTSCWFIDKPRQCDLHPTMKPIELIANALLNSTEKKDSVLDIFGGSGSTLIACEQLDRKCYMMEIDPGYCDVIIARWEDLTGKKAVKIA